MFIEQAIILNLLLLTLVVLDFSLKIFLGFSVNTVHISILCN